MTLHDTLQTLASRLRVGARRDHLDDLLRHEGVEDLLPHRYRPEPQSAPLDNPIFAQQVWRAQRIVESRNFDRRQALRTYAQIVEGQRRLVAEERRSILMDDRWLQVLPSRATARYREASELIGNQAARDLERLLRLHAIDQAWADHLAEVAEIREGIHLAAIGGLSPLDEFVKAVAASFEANWLTVEDRPVEGFLHLPITERGADFVAAGLSRPSATWTYLVQEEGLADPFATSLFSSRHIGLAVGAAMTGPLLLLWGLQKRLQGKRKAR